MLQEELTHMDRITQLQDEIQNILLIMSNTLSYLTTRSNFLQVTGSSVPVTKQRNKDKYDEETVFEANKKELVTDLIVKAKQIDFLIDSLPEPEPEDAQAQRLQHLEDEMAVANAEYVKAVRRAKGLHAQMSELLRMMLNDADLDQPSQNQEDD